MTAPAFSSYLELINIRIVPRGLLQVLLSLATSIRFLASPPKSISVLLTTSAAAFTGEIIANRHMAAGIHFGTMAVFNRNPQRRPPRAS
jgi:hypothetical protein